MTELDKQAMGRRLKAALKLRSMKQKELAYLADLTEAAVSHYIKGDRLPKTSVAIQICNILHVSLDWYVNGYCKHCNRNQDETCIGCKYLGEG